MESIIIHLGSTSCDICHKTFDKPLDVELHISSEHKEILQCCSCNLNFANIYALARHTELTGDVCNPQMKPCTQCGEVFLTKKLLAQHMQADHVTQKRKPRAKKSSSRKKNYKRCTCSGRNAKIDEDHKNIERTNPYGEIAERTDPYGEIVERTDPYGVIVESTDPFGEINECSDPYEQIVERTSLSDHDYAKSYVKSERNSPSPLERKTPLSFEPETIQLSPSWSYIGETVEIYSYEENIKPENDPFDLERSGVKKESDDDKNQEDYAVKRTDALFNLERSGVVKEEDNDKNQEDYAVKRTDALFDLERSGVKKESDDDKNQEDYEVTRTERAWPRIRVTHEPTCPFSKKRTVKVKCDQCDSSFNCAAVLRYHKRIHTGEKPFQCSYCEKRFRIKQQLVVHTRVHTGERPYKCPHCGRAFSTIPNIHRHQLVHTKERPYSCEICGNSFQQYANLKLHIQTVHLGIPAKPRKRVKKVKV